MQMKNPLQYSTQIYGTHGTHGKKSFLEPTVNKITRLYSRTAPLSISIGSVVLKTISNLSSLFPFHLPRESANQPSPLCCTR